MKNKVFLVLALVLLIPLVLTIYPSADVVAVDSTAEVNALAYHPYSLYVETLNGQTNVDTIAFTNRGFGALVGQPDTSYEDYSNRFGSFNYTFSDEFDGTGYTADFVTMNWYPTAFSSDFVWAGYEVQFHDFIYDIDYSSTIKISSNVVDSAYYSVVCWGLNPDGSLTKYAWNDYVSLSDVTLDKDGFFNDSIRDIVWYQVPEYIPESYFDSVSIYVESISISGAVHAPSDGTGFGNAKNRPLSITSQVCSEVSWTDDSVWSWEYYPGGGAGKFLDYVSSYDPTDVPVIDPDDFDGSRLASFLSDSVGGFLSAPVIGSVSFGDLLLVVVGISLVTIFLKMFAGG